MVAKSSPPRWLSFSKYLAEMPADGQKPQASPAAPQIFFNRELSWLKFNDRVLSEAQDATVPPLDRLRFATIVSSNLDEFFMVRVAEIEKQVKRARSRRYSLPSSPSRVLAQIREQVIRQKERQSKALKEVIETLGAKGIKIHTDFKTDRSMDAEIKQHLPDLNFIIRRSSEPLPPLQAGCIHIFIRFEAEFAVISIPTRKFRLLRLPDIESVQRFVLLERWLCARAQEFFPDKEILEVFPFKIIRDADLNYRRDDEDTIEEQIVEAVNKRLKAKVVRLEVDGPSYSEGALFLSTLLGMDSAALYRFNLPLDLKALAEIYEINKNGPLAYPLVEPTVPLCLRKGSDIFESIRRRDLLLHHPYDSFDVIVQFLQQAAIDPAVTEIYHTMYRTSKESPIMAALKDAAQSGKKVTVYVEIKARFDELNNVRWARELRRSGVKVVKPLHDFKVHCKLTQVIRQEGAEKVFYTHLGTGNYHPGTARLYTDLGLLTADPKLGNEISAYFLWLASRESDKQFRDILVAPRSLDKQFLKLIRTETEIQKSGGQGHIIAKMNSLVDPNIINALYDASSVGVKIELIVRGICCLKPGVKGLSENIRVRSVVDRFLEHSRIYYFRAGGEDKIFLSSADWMPRNFNSRYELAFLIKDPDLKNYILNVILSNSFSDNVKAWELKSDGRYARTDKPENAKPIRSQHVFEQLAAQNYRGTALSARTRQPAANSIKN